jgi:hypothetical protein
MKVLCKKNHKHFKKGKWYDAIIQDLNCLEPKKFTNFNIYKNEVGYSNYEIRQAYLISPDILSYCVFYIKESNYSKIEENIFSMYFYTKQEARKEKLKKLKI